MNPIIAELLPEKLPTGNVGYRGLGWHGMVWFIATESMLFAYLLFGYYYLAVHAHAAWLPVNLPELHLALPNTLLLLASSMALWWGVREIKRDHRRQLTLGLGLAIIMGSVFITILGLDWHNQSYTLSDGAYGSLYFTTTGFHLAHVVGGLVILLLLLVWTAFGYFNAIQHTAVSIGALYWYFVNIVWLVVFTTFYLLPYLR